MSGLVPDARVRGVGAPSWSDITGGIARWLRHIVDASDPMGRTFWTRVIAVELAIALAFAAIVVRSSIAYRLPVPTVPARSMGPVIEVPSGPWHAPADATPTAPSLPGPLDQSPGLPVDELIETTGA
jgi:hypothetical protein